MSLRHASKLTAQERETEVLEQSKQVESRSLALPPPSTSPATGQSASSCTGATQVNRDASEGVECSKGV